jgi:tetratricopeptide (TPR) repeat protein
MKRLWGMLVVSVLIGACSSYVFAQSKTSPGFFDDNEQMMRERYEKVLAKNPFQERAFNHVYDSYLSVEGIDAWIGKLLPEDENVKPDIATALILGQIYDRLFDAKKAIEMFEIAAAQGEDRAQFNVLLGSLYYKIGQNDKAAALLVKALTQLKDVDKRVQVSRMLGNLHIRKGNRADAIKVWSRIVEQNPEEIFSQLELAEIYEDNLMWQEAIEVYRQIVKFSNDDPYRKCRSLRSIGQCMIRLERYREAIATFEETLELVAPGNWLFEDIKLRMISVYQDLGDLSGLTKYILARLDAHPNDLEFHDLLAETYTRMIQFDKAEKEYQFILERDPKKVVVYEKLIALYERMKKPDQQIAMIEKLIEAYPKESDYYRRLGDFYLRNGDPDKAKESWKRWVDGDAVATRWADLAGWYESYDFIDEAIAAYHKALDMQKNNEWSYRLAGLVYQTGDKDEALKIWLSVLDDQTSTANDYAEVASILRVNQFLPESSDLLKKAIEKEPENFEHHFALAKICMQQEKFEEALQDYELLAGQDDNQYLKEKGEKGRLDAYSEMGVLEEKQQEWENKLLANPDSVDQLTRLARLYERAGQREQAIELYERRKDIDPGNPQYLRTLASLYKSSKQMDEAIELLNRLVEIDKNRARAYLKDLLDIYLAVDMRDEAIDKAEQIVDLAVSDPEARLDLAQVYQLYNEPEKSLQQTRYALRLEPDEPDYHRQYGVSLSQEKRWGEAQQAFRKMMETAHEDQTKSTAVQNLARIYMQQSNLDDLITEFQRRIRNTPKRIPAYKELAVIYKEAGQIFRAIEVLENGLQNVEDKQPIVKHLIRESYEANDFERVRNYYEQLLAISGKPSAFEYERLGKIYAQLGDIDKAKETWSKIVEEAPDDAKAYDQYSKILSDEGYGEEALLAKARAVELDEFNFKRRLKYAQLLSQHEQPIQAMEQLQKILEIGEREEKKEEKSKEKKIKHLGKGQAGPVNPYMFSYGMSVGGRGYYGGSWQGSFKEFRPRVIAFMANLAQSSVGVDSFLESYQQRLKKEPHNTDLRRDMILIYQSFNNVEEALKIAEELIAITPNDVDLIQQTALFYSTQQKHDQAISLMERLAQEFPKYKKQAMQGLIPLYIQNKQDEKAASLADEMIEENPSDFQTIYSICSMMRQQGKIDIAKKIFQKRIEQADPRYRFYMRRTIASMYQQAGEIDEALDIYKEILQDDNPNYAGRISVRRQMKIYVPEVQNRGGMRMRGMGRIRLPHNVVQNFDSTKSNALTQIMTLQKDKEDSSNIITELENEVNQYPQVLSIAQKNKAWDTAKMLFAYYLQEKQYEKITSMLDMFKAAGMESVELYNLSIYTA